MVLDATGSITSFAGEYLQQHQIHEDFEVTPAIMDELHLYWAIATSAPDRAIGPPIGLGLRAA